MTREIIVTAAESETTAVAVARHWHISESGAGYLPESEPYTTNDSESALDFLAHELDEWANSHDNPEHPHALYAAGVAEIYCTCRDGARSAEHHDAVTAVEDDEGICEQIGRRVFELAPCADKDCLKYCPDADCGTVSPITDSDTRCWACGATYVPWDEGDWLA